MVVVVVSGDAITVTPVSMSVFDVTDASGPLAIEFVE